MSLTHPIIRSIVIASAMLYMPIAAVHAEPVPVGPDEFVVTCSLLDPASLQAKMQAKPGEPILLRATVLVGENVFSKAVTIGATASVKAFGLGLQSSLGSSTLMIPAAAQREQIQETYGNGEPLPYQYGESVDQLFNVPDNFPPAIATIKVTAQILKAKKQCSKALEILDPTALNNPAPTNPPTPRSTW